MVQTKKTGGDAVDIRITADGVFVAEDRRCDWGDVATVPADIAAILIERGHAKRK